MTDMITPELTLEQDRQTRQAGRNPWAWVPSLYLAQGIPYVMVMTVSVIIYKRMGISNTDIALYTSWLYLPWVIKPLWSPIVDVLGTKRRWIVVMQGLIAVTLAMVAFSIPGPRFFQYTLAFFWLMAFSSATHDIAADGFYMLGLEQHQQAAFVGVRSTFYRIATIAAQGLLVVLAGFIETHSGLTPVDLNVVVTEDAANAPIVLADAMPAGAPEASIRVLAEPAKVEISTVPRDKAELDAVLEQARQANIANGFCAAPATAAAGKNEPSWWSAHVAQPMENFLRERFGDPRLAAAKPGGNIGVATVRLSGKPEPGRNIVVVLNRKSGDESIEVAEGARLVFNEHNWDKPAHVVFKTNPRLQTAAEASFSGTSGNIPLAWSTVSGVLAVLFLLFCVYHKFALPYPASDGPTRSEGANSILREFFATFVEFFRKNRISIAIAFLLFFRFAEAQLVKLVSPFLLDSRDVGGLGLTTEQVGWVYGTIGIGALMAGGLLGGYVISRQGLRFWLWPMVIIMHTPDLAFVYLAYAQPEHMAVITGAVALEQFGYGFGFTAYMLFMILIADGEHKTAHYAICTGFMALGMMLPGMLSGWIQETVGYPHFFVWVVISTIPGFIVAALVRIPPEFGRKAAA